MKKVLIIIFIILLILPGTCYADGLDSSKVEAALPDDAK